MNSSQSSSLDIATTDQRYLDTRQAFDSVAERYSGPLGNNRLVQQMRQALWRGVESSAPPRSRLLDLGCGTGLDAAHFATQGYSVTAIDWSPAMVAQTRLAAEAAGVGERVSAANRGIQELDQISDAPFDCIYSDLGALNCVADLQAVAESCARLLAVGGSLVFSVVGRYCPWELAYYALRGNFARATVRFAPGEIPVGLNQHTVWTRYYAPAEFYRHFSRHFKLRKCRGLNLFLPPPYLIGFYDRHPGFRRALGWLDQTLGGLWPFNRAGDHFLMMMIRR